MDVIAIITLVGLCLLLVGLIFGSGVNPAMLTAPSGPNQNREAEVLRKMLDAVEMVDKESVRLANRLLENPNFPLEGKESVKTHLTELEQSFETIGSNREALDGMVNSARMIVRIPDFEGLRDPLHAQWIDAISNQGILLKLVIDHDPSLTPSERVREYALTRVAAIRAAVATLEVAKIEAGGITPDDVVECIRALVVETVTVSGRIDDDEVDFLNTLFGLDSSSEAYIAAYPGAPAEGRAARNMVELITRLTHYNPPAAGFLAGEVDNVLLSAIAADGTADEQEFVRANAYKDLLRERLGLEDEQNSVAPPLVVPTRAIL